MVMVMFSILVEGDFAGAVRSLLTSGEEFEVSLAPRNIVDCESLLAEPLPGLLSLRRRLRLCNSWSQ